MRKLRLTVQDGVSAGRRFELLPGNANLGRQDGCTVTLKESSVSSIHAVFITDRDGRWWLQDNRSTNGTLCDGVRLGQQPILLLERGRIQVARIGIAYEQVPVPVHRTPVTEDGLKPMPGGALPRESGTRPEPPVRPTLAPSRGNEVATERSAPAWPAEPSPPPGAAPAPDSSPTQVKPRSQRASTGNGDTLPPVPKPQPPAMPVGGAPPVPPSAFFPDEDSDPQPANSTAFLGSDTLDPAPAPVEETAGRADPSVLVRARVGAPREGRGHAVSDDVEPTLDVPPPSVKSPGSARTSSGRGWKGTVMDLQVYRAELEPEVKTPPPIHLEEHLRPRATGRGGGPPPPPVDDPPETMTYEKRKLQSLLDPVAPPPGDTRPAPLEESGSLLAQLRAELHQERSLRAAAAHQLEDYERLLAELNAREAQLLEERQVQLERASHLERQLAQNQQAGRAEASPDGQDGLRIIVEQGLALSERVAQTLRALETQLQALDDPSCPPSVVGDACFALADLRNLLLSGRRYYHQSRT